MKQRTDAKKAAYSFLILLIIFGILLWGIGMGAQESILKSTVTSLVAKNRRATAFGIFNTGFGLFWFVGSFLMGVLYDVGPGCHVSCDSTGGHSDLAPGRQE